MGISLHFEPKLPWKPHVDAKCSKALAAFYKVHTLLESYGAPL